VLKAIGGFVPAARGAVRHDGADVTRWSPERRARAGVALVPEDRGLVADMTVHDHLWLGHHGRPDGRVLESVFEVFPRLSERLKTKAGKLSGGEAQMLAIASAMLLNPKTLLIDELSFGLSPILVKELLRRCRELAESQGMGIILVEQFVDLALANSDRAVVLSQGVIRLEGPSPEVDSRRDEVAEAYLHYGKSKQ
jgi:branched-chain amino acid transport system ATP-binding protein